MTLRRAVNLNGSASVVARQLRRAGLWGSGEAARGDLRRGTSQTT